MDGAPYAQEMGIVRPDRVLVVGTVEDYTMTVQHKVSEKKLAAPGCDTTSWLTYEEECGLTTRGARVVSLCIRRGLASLPYSPPFLPTDSGTSPATIGLVHSDGLQGTYPRDYQEIPLDRA
jgi:hypothetical protein